MSSYLLYLVFDALYDHRFVPHVAVFYAEAVDYFPQQGEWQRVQAEAAKARDFLEKADLYEKSGFLSLGVDAIYESESFPGQNVSALPTQIVAVPNFSWTRMREMLAYAENQYNAAPKDAIWVIGQPPDEQKNGWRFDAMKDLYQPMRNVLPVGTRDYKQMLWHLADLWETLNIERHLVLAVLGSKMQHLGVFFFLKMRQDTGLLLSEPRAFVANRYSTGVGPTWWIEFGSMTPIKALMSSYGMLDFQWD
jgi:hypothetical protein